MTKKQTVEADVYIGVTEAAEIAGVDRRTINRWLKSGAIVGQPLVFGSRTFMRVSALSLRDYLLKRGDQVAA